MILKLVWEQSVFQYKVKLRFAFDSRVHIPGKDIKAAFSIQCTDTAIGSDIFHKQGTCCLVVCECNVNTLVKELCICV